MKRSDVGRKKRNHLISNKEKNFVEILFGAHAFENRGAMLCGTDDDYREATDPVFVVFVKIL
jgi:hypothetical protein